MTYLRRAIPALVYLIAMTIVFRTWIASGFDLGFGDRADGIIEISLLEHWRNVFSGTAPWNAPLYFWPHRDTLGYNDGYLLFGIDYTVLRTVLDPFRADMANIAVFKTIGFVGSWWLARHTLRIDRGPALLTAFLFTTSAGMMHQAVHAQLQSIALLPVCAILAIAAVRHDVMGQRIAARLYGVSLALLMAAWLLTAFYMAWFTLFFALIFVCCWLFTSGEWRPARLVRLLQMHGGSVAIAGAALIVFTLPFLAVYLPKASESGAHHLGEARRYLVWFYDGFNVGEDNFLWGWTLRPLRWLFESIGGAQLANDKLGGEHVTGFAPLLFLLVILSIAGMGRRHVPAVLRAFALAIAISWLLTVQAGPLSPWALVYWLVPGASGLRVVLRYQLFLMLPALVLVMLAQRNRIRRLSVTHPASLVVATLVLVVEQLAPISSAALSRSRERVLLAVPRPPSQCHSFYVVKARPFETPYRDKASDAVYPHNVDAMLLAALWRLPTLNGYATFLPPDWVFAEPIAGDYDLRVRSYVMAHGLRGVCRLDARQAPAWRRVS